MLCSHISQATEQNTFGQLSRRMYVLIEYVVYYKIKRSAHIWHITLKYLIRIYRNLQPIQIQSVIGGEVFLGIGIFVLLLLTSRESHSLEISKCLCTRRIQSLSTIVAYQSLVLREKVYILLFCFHAYSPNSFLIQSYPFSSSSKANSGPAVFTIRPL